MRDCKPQLSSLQASCVVGQPPAGTPAALHAASTVSLADWPQVSTTAVPVEVAV